MNKKYEKGLVSVIIPVYNAEKYINDAILSVCCQSYSNVEIIVINDASTDSSEDVIKKLKKVHANIFYYSFKQNKGVSAARNKGIKLAKGQYIAFLDADDMWENNKIEKQIKFMHKFNVGFCFTAIDMIDESGLRVREKRSIVKMVDYNILLRNTVIPTSSVVLDRCMLGDVMMPNIRSGQDYAAWLRILRKGYVARGIDRPLTHYRLVSNSLSSKKYRSIFQVWNIQTKQEGINPIKATFNTICFILNALKKYYTF